MPNTPNLLASTKTLTPAARTARWMASQRSWKLIPLSPGGKLPLKQCAACDQRECPSIADCPCHQRDRAAICHGVLAASNNPNVIQVWINRYPCANWALVLGASGLLAVDLDHHGGTAPEQPLLGRQWPAGEPAPQDGVDTYAVLTSLAGGQLDLTHTLVIESPRNGLHLIYRVPDGTRWKSVAGKLGWQIDVKCFSGYCLIPGSTTEHGTYRRVSPMHEPTDLSQWLERELVRTGHDRHAEQREWAARRAEYERRPAVPPAVGRARYAQRALETACAELAAMGEDTGRGLKLLSSSSAMAGMAAVGWLDEYEARAALQTAASACGLEIRRIRATIRKGFNSPRIPKLLDGAA